MKCSPGVKDRASNPERGGIVLNKPRGGPEKLHLAVAVPIVVSQLSLEARSVVPSDANSRMRVSVGSPLSNVMATSIDPGVKVKL
jgi:hypothetical protein